MPPRVSSERTTPKPKVSSGAFFSHTSTACPCRASSAAAYSPPGPPPTTATRRAAGVRPVLIAPVLIDYLPFHWGGRFPVKAAWNSR